MSGPRRPLAVLVAALAGLALPSPAAASPRFIPQPPPRPLGVLVRDSKTIHVLRVKSVGLRDASFQTTAALKGKIDQAPFRLVQPLANAGCEGLFRVGEPVLCFREGEVAALCVGGRWALAVEPIAWRGEKEWFCLAERGYGVIYDGPAEALVGHVKAVLAGRETTIVARVPAGAGQDGGRRCRVKAGPDVTEFVLSDESPHFVGWGTGEPQEVAKLVQALRAAAPRDRITAAADLAHLGPAARSALPALRRALRDPAPAVALAAAKALTRLDPGSEDGLKAARALLGHADPDARSSAAAALADLGPLARPALPALLRALRDKDPQVRASAAEAVGPIAPTSPPPEAVAALSALLEGEKDAGVRSSVARSLRCFGAHAWTAAPALWASPSIPRESVYPRNPAVDALALLARFDPPPVELLAEVVADTRLGVGLRRAAADHLAALGARARPALPALRRVLQETPEGGSDDRGSLLIDNRIHLRLDAAEALLKVDPKGGPALAAPVLHALTKQPSFERHRAIDLLGRCGRAARPFVPGLVASLEPDDFFASGSIRSLTPLLGPGDRELLPKLRKLLSGKHGDALGLAEVLWQLGEQKEALALAARCLEGGRSDTRTRAARWLGGRGREARPALPALRRALKKAAGAERVRVALALWRVGGAEGSEPRVRALAALDALLDVSEGTPPAAGAISQRAFWRWGVSYAAWQEDDAVGAAVGTVHARLRDADDPVAVLARSLRDRSPHVRLAAAVALAGAEPRHPRIVPALRRLLERYPHFFVYAADTLAALGPAAAPFAPELLKLLRHPNENVYRTAGRVLRRIDPTLAGKGWRAAGVPDAVPADLLPLWEDLAGRDAFRADLAVWRLAGAGPRAVTLLRQRLRPPPALPPERIARLIADLDGDVFATRQRASAELSVAVESAAPAIRKTLAARPSLEVRRRLEGVLLHLDPSRVPEQRRRLRAVRLLAEIGSPEGRALLEKWARGDPRFRMTQEAAAAVRR